MNPNMTPVDWAKRPIQKYADFSGRASRSEFWWFVLAVIIASIVAKIIDNILGMSVAGPYGPLSALLVLGLIVPYVAVMARRLHDTNRSGWWILLPVVFYVLAFVLGGAAMVGGAMTGGAAGMAAGAGLAGILLLIGAVCWIVLIVFWALPGTPGDNRYGPNPYGAVGTASPAE